MFCYFLGVWVVGFLRLRFPGHRQMMLVGQGRQEAGKKPVGQLGHAGKRHCQHRFLISLGPAQCPRATPSDGAPVPPFTASLCPNLSSQYKPTCIYPPISTSTQNFTNAFPQGGNASRPGGKRAASASLWVSEPEPSLTPTARR